MRQVDFEDLEPGFVLAKDVERADGSKLLGRGTVLSETQMALLESWKVRQVWIEDAPSPEQEEAESAETKLDQENDSPLLKAARKRLRDRFEGRLVNPWMEALYAEASERLATSRYWRSTR